MYSNERSSENPPACGRLSELRSSGHDAEPQLALAQIGNSRSTAIAAMLRNRTDVLLRCRATSQVAGVGQPLRLPGGQAESLSYTYTRGGCSGAATTPRSG